MTKDLEEGRVSYEDMGRAFGVEETTTATAESGVPGGFKEQQGMPGWGCQERRRSPCPRGPGEVFGFGSE